MQISSAVFAAEQTIPDTFTCKGPNINPPLSWTEVPEKTQSFILFIEDADAQPKPWVHWLVFDISGNCREIQEDSIPDGAVEGICNGGTHGYEGPCMKYFSGTHHYVFHLLALDTVLKFPDTADKETVLTAAKGHILDVAHLKGIAQGEKK